MCGFEAVATDDLEQTEVDHAPEQSLGYLREEPKRSLELCGKRAPRLCTRRPFDSYYTSTVLAIFMNVMAASKMCTLIIMIQRQPPVSSFFFAYSETYVTAGEDAALHGLAGS